MKKINPIFFYNEKQEKVMVKLSVEDFNRFYGRLKKLSLNVKKILKNYRTNMNLNEYIDIISRIMKSNPKTKSERNPSIYDHDFEKHDVWFNQKDNTYFIVLYKNTLCKWYNLDTYINRVGTHMYNNNVNIDEFLDDIS